MKLGIGRRLTGTYFLVIFITVAIFELALITGINYYYLSSINNNLKNQAEMVAGFHNNFLDSTDLYSSARQLIDIFAQESFQIQITDKRGKVIADSLGQTRDQVLDTTDIMKALQGAGDKFKGRDQFSGERIASWSAPLISQGTVVGAVRFTSSLELTYQVIYGLAQYLIVFGLFLILGVSIISYFLAQTIVVPVEEITRTAEQMAQGNLKVRSQVVQADEIGVLAGSLNHMAAQLEKHEELKNEFISSISHELRTPLTSIEGWAQTLKGTPSEAREEMQYGLDIIISESERLNEMVEDLLDLSRLEACRLRLYPEPTEINGLLRTTYEQLKPRADKQGVDYRLELSAEEQVLDIDPRRVKQILINLLDNSLKFTAPGGEICLSGGRRRIEKQDFYSITVTDTGSGIPTAEVSLLKERFYKSPQNALNKGAGLGLAICDELIRLHGGTMEIDSEVGRGTVVTVNLPITS